MENFFYKFTEQKQRHVMALLDAVELQIRDIRDALVDARKACEKDTEQMLEEQAKENK